MSSDGIFLIISALIVNAYVFDANVFLLPAISVILFEQINTSTFLLNRNPKWLVLHYKMN